MVVSSGPGCPVTRYEVMGDPLPAGATQLTRTTGLLGSHSATTLLGASGTSAANTIVCAGEDGAPSPKAFVAATLNW